MSPAARSANAVPIAAPTAPYTDRGFSNTWAATAVKAANVIPTSAVAAASSSEPPTGSPVHGAQVVEDHVLDTKLRAAAILDVPGRRAQDAQAMVARVAQRDVAAETEVQSGHGAEQVLAAAGRCGADLIVVARELGLPAGSGVNGEHLLEFADVPVLVVPPVPER